MSNPCEDVKPSRILMKSKFILNFFFDKTSEVTHWRNFILQKNYWAILLWQLTHLFLCTLSLPPENRKPYYFLMFLEGRERVHSLLWCFQGVKKWCIGNKWVNSLYLVSFCPPESSGRKAGKKRGRRKIIFLFSLSNWSFKLLVVSAWNTDKAVRGNA